MHFASILAIAAATFPSPAPDTPEPLRDVRRIVCLGDSITEAGGQPGGYVWLLDRILNNLYGSAGKIEVINAGISGQKAPDMRARFRRDVLDRKPDLVTISVGVNDVWHAYRDFAAGVDHPAGELPAGVPLPRYRENLIAMIEAARAARVRVVLLSPTLIYERLDSSENLRLSRYIAAMRSIAQERGCRFVDLNRPFREVIGSYQKEAGRTGLLLTTDGVHMNGAGNRLLACSILRALGVPQADIDEVKLKYELRKDGRQL